MSGHSKWHTTKRHKAVIDAKRGKIFSVLAKEITLAARAGGGSPESNVRLRTLMDKARASNMPSDNIKRAVQKGTGEIPGVIYEEIVYEGYAPGGVGLIIEVTTDNKNRAAAVVQRFIRGFIARRRIRRLAALCGLDETQVRAALALIARLEPKPGRRFADVQRNIVVPDVIVRKTGRGHSVTLNPDVMPKLRINDIYAQAARGLRGASANPGMSSRLQEARWFVKNIQQRFDTILRVSTAIVERQRDFFLQGELAMRPLVQAEIADELGLHESTISRVTSSKYMATPFGTYELKYFFGSSLGTEAGGNASSTAVRALIRQLVAAENPNKPLSDNQISEMLKEQGIECARRTVAKYREALRIAPANLRKTL
jgi:RNA polymerase sigma-54 factor